jgi:hypothetical protein
MFNLILLVLQLSASLAISSASVPWLGAPCDILVRRNRIVSMMVIRT